MAGQPIEIDDARCMLFTFADLEPRRRAERALKNMEAFTTITKFFGNAWVTSKLQVPRHHKGTSR